MEKLYEENSDHSCTRTRVADPGRGCVQKKQTDLSTGVPLHLDLLLCFFGFDFFASAFISSFFCFSFT